ncbi:tyrosine-type recombinase/integrase [Mesorhizobium sp. M0913]|uniref:tyrosine-type recombinase/integrase n=1 Tax=Mesorhizobium sp. M0913 TaxID=2957026 RepID=UPI003337C196
MLARFLSGAPRTSVIGWHRPSRRPAPRSPTTSCALDRRWKSVSVPVLHAALGPFKCASPVSRIARKRLRHGGVELGRVAGAHLLRHSLATQLVRQRRPINEVADLLGHRSINTTALYVKVAASQLAEVALPFPGGIA